MKLIVYAGSRLMTGDEIALSVLEYCAALADAGTAETIEIPVLTAEGVRSHATLLVGPSSQIVAEDADSSFDELVDPEMVALIRAKTRVHRPVAGSSAQNGHHGVWENDY
jgi:hypothetical protein